MRQILLSLFATCLSAAVAVAHNNYFLPGDAFFAVEISRTDMTKWMESKEANHEFTYSRFDGEFFACGNIGYAALAVEGITPEFRLALTEAYWRLSRDQRPTYREEDYPGKSSLTQTNSVVALIYHKSFDLQMPLGLKFNEDWPAQGRGRYCGFLDSAKAVTEDWSGGPKVPALAVRENLDPMAHATAGYDVPHSVQKPLHIHADDIQIVLVGFAEQRYSAATQRCPDLQKIFDAEEGATYTVVTKGKIREFEVKETGMEETATEVPVKGRDSRIPERVVPPEAPKK